MQFDRQVWVKLKVEIVACLRLCKHQDIGSFCRFKKIPKRIFENKRSQKPNSDILWSVIFLTNLPVLKPVQRMPESNPLEKFSPLVPFAGKRPLLLAQARQFKATSES